MSFTVSIESTAGHCLVVAHGHATLAEYSGLAAMVAEVVERYSHRRVIADLRGTEPVLSFTDHLHFGAQVSTLFRKLSRLAVVVRPEYMDSPAAKAARLAGLNVQAFLELESARAWIDALPASAGARR